MFGFVFGTLCLIGFTRVAFGHRYCHRGFHRRFGHRHGCGEHGGYYSDGHCGGSGRWGHGHWGRGRWGSDRALYYAFERLNTSPGQEKAIRGALQDLRDSLGALRPAVQSLRQDIASVFKEETFTAAQAENILHSRDPELGQARAALALTISRIHEALDPDQRERVARWAAEGPRAWGF
jgi:uncharacterized membrane protein